MKHYEVTAGFGVDSVRLVDGDRPAIGENDIRIAIEAAAVNKRDQWIIEGRYHVPHGGQVVPLSDGCGTVVEVGSSAARFAVGDRVIPTFFPSWTDGEISAEKTKLSFGAKLPGTAAEEMVVCESGLVKAPRDWSAIEAATLPCAGLTAWNALFVAGDLKPDQTVLLLGTGGVSVWALQLAVAAGVRVIVTSSSDQKLQRARELGAALTINYRDHMEWQDEVRRLTDGIGVDVVLEVGGAGTIVRSIAAVRTGGTVVVIGGVAGDGEGIDPRSLIEGAVTLAGVMVGSRAMLEDLVTFVEEKGVRPIIDRQFAFDDLASAYRHLMSGDHLGKIVIDGAANVRAEESFV